MAIEKIQIGDRVLAQDADTGELAYKPVLGTTIRPPADLIAMTTSKGLLRSTRGHAFWIDGKGWQMAKAIARPATGCTVSTVRRLVRDWRQLARVGLQSQRRRLSHLLCGGGRPDSCPRLLAAIADRRDDAGLGRQKSVMLVRCLFMSVLTRSGNSHHLLAHALK